MTLTAQPPLLVAVFALALAKAVASSSKIPAASTLDLRSGSVILLSPTDDVGARVHSEMEVRLTWVSWSWGGYGWGE